MVFVCVSPMVFVCVSDFVKHIYNGFFFVSLCQTYILCLFMFQTVSKIITGVYTTFPIGFFLAILHLPANCPVELVFVQLAINQEKLDHFAKPAIPDRALKLIG